MTAPGPFELGKAMGGNVMGAFGRSQENTALDQILGEASQSTNPDAMQNAMSQIMQNVSPDRQPQALQILQQKQKQLTQQKQQQALQKFGFPEEFSSLPQPLQLALVKERGVAMAQQSKVNAENKKLSNALKSIDRIDELLKGGNIGPRGSSSGTARSARSLGTKQGRKDTLKDREELKTLGRSLISEISSIKVRNQREFDVLKGELDNPDATIETLQGAYNAVRRIVQNKLTDNDQQGQPGQNITDDQIDQLLQQYGGDVEKVNQLLSGGN